MRVGSDFSAGGSPAQAAALLAWWRLAGVDNAVSDAPYCWLDAAARVHVEADRSAIAPMARRSPTAAKAPVTEAPEDWDRFTTLDALLAHVRQAQPGAPILDGSVESGILLVGDAPSADDLRDGLPFSGPRGAFLDRMMAAIGLDRSRMALTLMAPRRTLAGMPPADVLAGELPLVKALVRLAAPKRLLLLGTVPAQGLSGDRRAITALRGQWVTVDAGGGAAIPALVTYSPSHVLGHPEAKALIWADLLEFRKSLT